MSTFETTLTNEAFEKWYKEKYYKYDLYPKYAQFRKEMEEVWQAATAERDKLVMELQATNRELSASINELREALEKIATADIWQNKYAKFADEAKKIATDAISETPAQSLQAHDNDVIERCAKVVTDDVMAVSYQSTRGYRNALIQAIRALKGK